MKKRVVIIGAGPAGLTAGIELLKRSDHEVKILERDNIIGGLARTNDYKNYKFDIGPHHFITEKPEIEKWWKDLMGPDFIKHHRFTRILYKKKYFNYPLNGLNVIRNLNIFECVSCVLSYVKYRFFPIKDIKSFEDWVINKFGKRLFNIFFKTYTEKVWGIPCNKISSDWASQRIKGFSMSKAIFYAFFGKWFKKNAPRTLSDEFYYPPNGSGQLWNRVADNIKSNNDGDILLNQNVVSIKHNDGQVNAVLTKNNNNAESSLLNRYNAQSFLSSMPLQALINALKPLPEKKVLDAANSLVYRGLITVNLVIDKENIFPDHWVYIHDKDVKMGRIGNMGNFSEGMLGNKKHSTLSLEYFTYVGDEIWNASEEDLIALGKKELSVLGIAKEEQILDGIVIKSPEAYPVYDENYQEHLNIVLGYLSNFSNLNLMGRNGMHRYNNMDIAMLSAFKAVDQILLKPDFDILEKSITSETTL
ncbi:NAD(P)/FAD-dependent oxidoreductase [Candidatus Babeliales bacterium]|nr:NAD(P)/FAD-dependent oxidoreductase [Candidatus Babeliales bacterium]